MRRLHRLASARNLHPSCSDEQSEDLLYISLSRVCTRNHEYYHIARLWANQRNSQETKFDNLPEELLEWLWPIRLFLADAGNSGITVAKAELGYAVWKDREYYDDNCRIAFHTPAEGRGRGQWVADGICLEPRTTFQELLSWLR